MGEVRVYLDAELLDLIVRVFVREGSCVDSRSDIYEWEEPVLGHLASLLPDHCQRVQRFEEDSDALSGDDASALHLGYKAHSVFHLYADHFKSFGLCHAAAPYAGIGPTLTLLTFLYISKHGTPTHQYTHPTR